MTQIPGLFNKDLYYIKVKRWSFPCPWQEGIACSGVEERLHSFVTSALDEGEWLTSRPGHFTPVKGSWYQLGEPRSRNGLLEKRKIFRSYRDSKRGPSSP